MSLNRFNGIIHRTENEEAVVRKMNEFRLEKIELQVIKENLKTEIIELTLTNNSCNRD